MEHVQKAERKEHLWRAAEHEHRDKEMGWYIIIGFVALIFFVVALFQKNFLFAVFIITATGLLFSFSRRRPIIYEFKVDKTGVWVEKKLYPYERLIAFSIRDRINQLHELVIHQRGTTKPHIHIPIDVVTLKSVRPFLAEYLPELEHEETAGSIFADFIGF
ncbi:hypothetical protein C4565_01080 [Candidatus Parcubacteria bacterium]|jgi:hypothetical protein|nr:MAG: hypothetical protein C4565_01080 [Candidatus Parcubacteria bacterium]